MGKCNICGKVGTWDKGRGEVISNSCQGKKCDFHRCLVDEETQNAIKKNEYDKEIEEHREKCLAFREWLCQELKTNTDLAERQELLFFKRQLEAKGIKLETDDSNKNHASFSSSNSKQRDYSSWILVVGVTIVSLIIVVYLLVFKPKR